MEPIRFADIIFIVAVLAVTFGILYLVQKSRKKPSITEDDEAPETGDKQDEDDQ